MLKIADHLGGNRVEKQVREKLRKLIASSIALVLLVIITLTSVTFAEFGDEVEDVVDNNYCLVVFDDGEDFMDTDIPMGDETVEISTEDVFAPITPANIVTGTLGPDGAPWEFNETTGVMTVGAGSINLIVSSSANHFWNVVGRNNINVVVFDGPLVAGDSLNSFFQGFTNLTAIQGLSYLDTSNVTAMVSMFSGAASLTGLDLSSWDTSNVTNMSSMFFNTRSLTTLDVSNWNTSYVIHMGNMFQGTSSLTTLDVVNWNTGSATNMNSMFHGASSLTTLDVANWNTSNVTSMSSMFNGSSSITTLDVSNWNTSNVTSMGFMFQGANSLTTLDVSNWNTSNVTSMGSMFGWLSPLRQLTLGPNFHFVTFSIGLPDAPSTPPYSGHWQNVENGTVANPQGNYAFTTQELMAHHNANAVVETWVWRIQPELPTITVGTQSGTLTAGQTGTVSFPVTTTNLPVGNHLITVANMPEGVSAPVTLTIADDGTGALTLAGLTTTLAGITDTLTLSIDEAISNEFTLTIIEPVTANYEVMFTSGFIGGPADVVVDLNDFTYLTVAQIPTFTRTGHQFMGWSSENEFLTTTELLTIEITESITFTAVWNLIPEPFNPTSTVIVDVQNEVLTAGQVGTVTFSLATTHIPSGVYNGTVANLPRGVRIEETVTIDSSGLGTLTLVGNTTTLVGIYNNLTLTLDSVTSAPFTLNIVTLSNVPQTGDDTPLGYWIGLSVVSGLGLIIFVGVAGLKRKKEDKED